MENTALVRFFKEKIFMNIVIVGLGIIGGSIAKALKKNTEHYIIGIDKNHSVEEKALSDGAIDSIGDIDSLGVADVIYLAIYPGAAVEYVEENGKYIKQGAIVTDTAGVKYDICPTLVELSVEYGFDFVGSHPMAGKEKNGYEASDPEIFRGASYIVIPCDADDNSVVVISGLARAMGFGGVMITSPAEHDRMIAFTSQLPHVLACAYVMSPCCKKHVGYSAGSYNDVSRVANINAELWSELFLDNKENLVKELDLLIENIGKIKNAIDNEDKPELTKLLAEGRKIKEELGE